MDDVRVGLDAHERLDLHRAVLAHPPEVVAAEVDEHHVLGALLLVGEQVGGDLAVLVGVAAARAGAGDRARRDVAPRHRHQRLGRCADDLEVLEVQEVHVRRRVDGAQPAVDRERLDRRRRRPALRGHDLEGVAGVHVLDDPGHHRLERLARHVGLELRLRALGGADGGPWKRAGEPLADLADRLDGARVRRLHPAVLLRVGVGEDRDRVAQVVEGEDHVGEHQRHVRQPDHVRVGLREALDRAHAVVAEEADRAARKRREAVDLRLAVARDLALGELVGVAAVGQAPAHDAARLVADERPAADALALLGGLEQEGRARPRAASGTRRRASRSPR